MEEKTIETLLNKYDEMKPIYTAFTTHMDSLIRSILKQNGFTDEPGGGINFIKSRVKSKKSFERKIRKKSYKYSSLEDITDMTGIRIVAYLESDVNKISKVLHEEFNIDEKNSIDKRKILEADKFGYKSVHYVVTLDEKRLSLPENSLYRNLKAEIQIRSTLQHAWAEIEHDISYKSKRYVPYEIKREFARLAGLLEIADREFENIKLNFDKYIENLPERLKNDPENVMIDELSLETYIKTDKEFNDFETKLLDKIGSTSTGFINLPLLRDILKNIDIRTIKDLKDELEKIKEEIINFIYIWKSQTTTDMNNPYLSQFLNQNSFYKGESLYYMVIVYAFKYKNFNLKNFLNPQSIMGYFEDEMERDNLPNKI